MKNKLFIITLLLMYMNVFSQDVYQETNLEFGNAMNSQESYLCEATTSIRLLPGFAYKPVEDKSMSLKIDRYSVFPPIDGYYGGMQTDDGGVVGSMSSSFNVSNTGAAIYSHKTSSLSGFRCVALSSHLYCITL